MHKIFGFIFVLLILLGGTAVVPAVSAYEKQQDRFFCQTELGFENLHFVRNRDKYSLNDQVTFAAEIQFTYQDQEHIKLDLRPRVRVDVMDASRNRYVPDVATFQYYGRQYELLVGMDLMNFGKSHFYNPTQVINRYDLEGNLFDPELMGEFILRTRFLFDDTLFVKEPKLDFFVLPLLLNTPLPESDMRYAVQGNFQGVPYQLDSFQSLPDTYIKSVGVGMLLSGMVSQFEWNVLGYHGPEKTPAYFLTTNSNGALRLRPFYYSVEALGTNFSFAVNRFLFHGEGVVKITAFNDVVTHNIPGQTQDLVPQTYLQFVPGVDYTMESFLQSASLRLTLEYYGENNTAQKLGEYRPFKSDVFFGFDLDLNNVLLTKLQYGIMKDIFNKETIMILDLDSRVYKKLKAGIRSLIVIASDDRQAPLSFFANNSFVMTRLSISL